MSFFTTLLYLIVTFIRPQEWVPALRNLPLVYWLAIGIIVFLISERFTAKKEVFIHVPQNGLMFGLFFSILMSHVVHSYFEGLLFSFNEFIVVFILFFILLNSLNTERKFKIALWVMVFLIFLLVPQGIYQLKNGYGWAGQDLAIDYTRDEVRITWIGIFQDPNDLALTFMMAIGVLVSFLFGKVSFLQRLVSFPLLGALLYGMYLTNSRGGYVALMTTCLFFFIRRTRRFVLGGIIGALAVAGIIAFGPSRLGMISLQEASAFNRVELWYQGILMLKSNPIFGVGFRMFEADLPLTAHNSFILAAAELGMVGLFFWVGLIYASYKGLSLVQAKEARLKTYALGVQSSLIGFCAAAFFLSRTYVILPYILFAFAGSLMYIAKKNNPELTFDFKPKDFGITALLSIGVLILAYGVIKIGL